MIRPDYLVITNRELSKKIFYHLSRSDLSNCALVNKAWHVAVQDARDNRTILISNDLLKQLSASKSNLDTYLSENLIHAPDVVINGREKDKKGLAAQIYDNLFNQRLRARHLTLRKRGQWLTCKCPKKASSCGEQIDSSDTDDITNLESITVKSTFHISPCALLDLVSRSPKLKTVRFFGVLAQCSDKPDEDHTELFRVKRFLCDLDCLMWPYVNKDDVPTLSVLLKRNENITCFYSNGEVTCDSLATGGLTNVKYLSLLLNERWIDEYADNTTAKRYIKRAQRFTNKINYLGLAKKIEALEIRTFNIPFDDDNISQLSELKLKLDPLYEQYKVTFWNQVAKLTNLKYLCAHGDWELGEVCRELAKKEIKVEFLRLGLLPASLQPLVDNVEDSLPLAMVDGARNLKKLPNLKSLWFTCYEKVISIEHQTATAFKDIMDFIWMMDIKVGFTEEVENLLNLIMRRGNQLGKTNKIVLHIQPKQSEYSSIVTELKLKFPIGTDLRQTLSQIAEAELSDRRLTLDAFQIWGLQQIDNSRDRATFEQIKNTWSHYNGKFNLTSPWQPST